MIDLQEISSDRLMAWTRAIARAPRVSGSREERAAAEYATGELRALGYATRILSHQAYISLPGRATLRVTSPERREVPCITHSMGLSTAAGGETARLLDADRFATNCMPETAALAAEAVRRAAGATLDARRVGRNSDQSFLGIGIPTVLGAVSHQDDGSLGWWWHTPEDTLERIDPARLVRDTGIFLHVVERLLTDPLLPLDYAASAADLRGGLEGLSAAAAGRFDLAPALAEAARLETLCARLPGRPGTSAPGGGSSRRAINTCLRELGRILIPSAYTQVARHGHDPALDVPFLPKLEGARRLAAMPPGSDAAHLLLVDLTRARSELVSALRRACATVESCLAGPGG